MSSPATRPLTPQQREDMIWACIGSLALSDIDLTYEEVAAVVDVVLAQPLVAIGKPDDTSPSIPAAK